MNRICHATLVFSNKYTTFFDIENWENTVTKGTIHFTLFLSESDGFLLNQGLLAYISVDKKITTEVFWDIFLALQALLNSERMFRPIHWISRDDWPSNFP